MKRHFVAAALILVGIAVSGMGGARAEELTQEERISLLKEHKVFDKYGGLNFYTQGKIADLPPDLVYPKGEFSLVVDPRSVSGEKIAVFVINDTQQAIPEMLHELNTSWQEVLVDGTWKRTEAVQLGCGTVPPATNLDTGCFIIDPAPYHPTGDLVGDVRYCIRVPNARPLASPALKGHYSSQLFAEGGHSITPLECEIDQTCRYGVLHGCWGRGSIARNSEEFIAALELMRSYSEMRSMRADLQQWLTEARKKKVGNPSEAEFKAALALALAGNWRSSPSEHGIFVRCYQALSTVDQGSYGTPEKCRSLIWRCLAFMTWERSFGFANPERYDQLVFFDASGNPWGADRNELASMLAMAEKDVLTGSPDVRNAAAWFFTEKWLSPAAYPDDRYRALLKSAVPEAQMAGVLGLANRGHRSEAIAWVTAHCESLDGRLLTVWQVLGGYHKPLAEWELPIVNFLLDKYPLRTFSNLLDRTRITKTHPDGTLPIGMRKPIREYLLREAKNKRVKGPRHLICDAEGQVWWDYRLEFCPRNLVDGLTLLARWKNKEDLEILHLYLQHPAATYSNGGPHRANKSYTIRRTAAELLKAAGAPVPTGIVMEEIIKVDEP